MTFDPLNAAHVAFYDLTPNDQKALIALEAKGLQVQILLGSASVTDHWIDSPRPLDNCSTGTYRICPRAFALHEIGQLPGKGPAIRKARDIVRGALG